MVARAAPALDLEWTAFGPTYEYAAAFRYGLGFEQHAERARTAFGGAELATPRDADEEAFLLGLCEGLPLMIGAEQFREGAWRDAASEELTYTNVVGTVAVGQAVVLTSAGWAPAQDAAGALLRRPQSRQVTTIAGSGGADLVLSGELASTGELLALPGDAGWTQHGAYEYRLESQSLSYAAHETTAATSGAVIAPVTTLAQNSLLTGLLAGVAAQAFVGVTQDDAGVWFGDPSFYEGVDHKVTADVWEPLWSRGSTFEVVGWSPSGFTLRQIHPNGTYDHVFVEQSDGRMRGTASFTTAVWYLTPSADGQWIGDPNFYGGLDHVVTADVWEPLWSRGSTYEVVNWSPSGFTLREVNSNGEYDHVFVEQSDGRMRGTASFHPDAVWYLTPNPAAGEPSDGWKSDGAPLSFTAWDQEASPGWSLIGSTATEAQFDSRSGRLRAGKCGSAPECGGKCGHGGPARLRPGMDRRPAAGNGLAFPLTTPTGAPPSPPCRAAGRTLGTAPRGPRRHRSARTRRPSRRRPGRRRPGSGGPLAAAVRGR